MSIFTDTKPSEFQLRRDPDDDIFRPRRDGGVFRRIDSDNPVHYADCDCEQCEEQQR